MKLKIIFSLLLALVSSFLVGSGIAMATGIDPIVTSSGVFIASTLFTVAMPTNALFGAVVFKTAYVDELLKQLKTVKGDFLSRIPDVSQLLDANTINYTKIGAMPGVLIDNSVYPIASATRTDDGKVVSLRKLTTLGTIITRAEIHNLPYDKTNSVIGQHKESLLESYYQLSLHAFAPNANTTNMPVLVTTGASDGTGRKRLLKEDLIKFRRALNEAGVSECDLVLCPEHVEDIMLWSQVFENQYHNIVSGIILPIYGFNIVPPIGYAPVYNAGTKVAYGAAFNAAHVKASVAYVPKRMFRAYGSVEMFYTQATAAYHQDEVNFDAYFIAAPKDDEGRGAIISGTV